MNSENGVAAGRKWCEGRFLFLLLVVLQGVLWILDLPLPHTDFDFFNETAIQLALFGKVRSPAALFYSQSLVYGNFFYPPGYYLVVAGWIKLFGYSYQSLLTYSHTVHFLYLLGLWTVLRRQMGLGPQVAAVAVLSAFPFFINGRADETAMMFGVAAWSLLPRKSQAVVGASVLSGLFLGCAAATSPHFGVALCVTVGAFVLGRVDWSLRQRLILVTVLTSVSCLLAMLVTVGVAIQQGDPQFALEQFQLWTHVRLQQLAELPRLTTVSTFVSTTLPFIILSLCPCLILLGRRKTYRDSLLAAACASFVGGAAAWWILNRAGFLYFHHFGFTARPILHASITSRWSRIGMCLILLHTLSEIVEERFVLFYLPHRLRPALAKLSEISIPPDSVVAVDSLSFLSLYRPERTIIYEALKCPGWILIDGKFSPRIRDYMDGRFHGRPLDPKLIIVSDHTLLRLGFPDPQVYRSRTDEPFIVPTVSLFGYKFSIPRDPYHFRVFELRG